MIGSNPISPTIEIAPHKGGAISMVNAIDMRTVLLQSKRGSAKCHAARKAPKVFFSQANEGATTELERYPVSPA